MRGSTLYEPADCGEGGRHIDSVYLDAEKIYARDIIGLAAGIFCWCYHCWHFFRIYGCRFTVVSCRLRIQVGRNNLTTVQSFLLLCRQQLNREYLIGVKERGVF